MSSPRLGEAFLVSLRWRSRENNGPYSYHCFYICSVFLGNVASSIVAVWMMPPESFNITLLSPVLIYEYSL
jgi:hypothetical protein